MLQSLYCVDAFLNRKTSSLCDVRELLREAAFRSSNDTSFQQRPLCRRAANRARRRRALLCLKPKKLCQKSLSPNVGCRKASHCLQSYVLLFVMTFGFSLE